MRNHSCLALLLLFAGSTSAAAQQRSPVSPYEISFGVSGDAGPEDSYNPLTVVYGRWPRYAPTLLGLINYTRPRSVAELATAAQLPDSIVGVIVAALDTCGMIRREQDRYQVTFAVFDDEVWTAFAPVMSSISDAIAERVESEILPRVRTEYPRTQLARNGVPFEIAAPLIIGAFGLDESAVEELQELGISRVRTAHPGNRFYTVLAQRNVPRTFSRGVLWGIHGMGLTGVFFGNFGDNSALSAHRSAVQTLPDVAWAWRATGQRRSEFIDGYINALASAARRFGSTSFSGAALSDSERSFLDAWREGGLVGASDSTRYRLTFPVFQTSDWLWAQDVAQRTGRIAVDAFTAALPQLAAAYAHTTPRENDVELAQALDHVYHYAYSRALDKIFQRNPALRFAQDSSALRYTGYAVVR